VPFEDVRKLLAEEMGMQMTLMAVEREVSDSLRFGGGA
jgi:hypothetical protein